MFRTIRFSFQHNGTSLISGVRTGSDGFPPTRVVAVPGHGFRKPLTEIDPRGIAQLFANFPPIERIAPVVPLAVLDHADRGPIRAAQFEQPLGETAVRPPGPVADVVDLPRSP